jgi:hypothetical protein
MAIEEIRDIVIIVFGIIGIVGFVLLLLMVFSLYRRLKVISAFTADSLVEIRKIIIETKKTIQPIIQIVAIIEAATKGFDLVNKIFGIKKGGQENESGTMD